MTVRLRFEQAKVASLSRALRVLATYIHNCHYSKDMDCHFTAGLMCTAALGIVLAACSQQATQTAPIIPTLGSDTNRAAPTLDTAQESSSATLPTNSAEAAPRTDGSQHTARLTTPTGLNPVYTPVNLGRDDRLTFGGMTFGVHKQINTVSNTGTGNMSIPNPNNIADDVARSTNPEAYRFTVGAANSRPDVNGIERAEIEGQQPLRFGTIYTWKTTVRYRGAIPVNDGWLVFMQIHHMNSCGGTGVPPLGVLADKSGNVQIITRSSTEKCTTRGRPPDMIRATFPMRPGQWHTLVVIFKLDYNGDGYMSLSYDGAQKFAGTVGLGYNDDKASYIKQGIYRSQTSGITTVEFRNQSFTAN